MIKRFCKRSIAIILTVITLVSLIPISLFSVEAANVNLNLDICQGYKSKKDYGPITAVNAASFQREGGYAWKITNGNGEYVYCIEPGVHLSWDDTMSTTSTESAWKKLDDAQKDTINAILAFGADGNRDNVKTGCATDEYGGSGVLDDEVYVATQLLVWELVKGVRNSAWPYDSSSGGYLHLFCDNGTYPNIKASYNYILDSLKTFQTLPSFTKEFENSAPTYTLDVKYNKDTGEYIYYSRELVDSNKVLSKFDFDSKTTINVGNANVTITQKGNKITLTPSNANKDKSSTSYSFGSLKNVVSPVPSNGKTTITVYASETAQDCIEGGSIDPPSAYFKVKVNIEEIEIERDFNLKKAVWTEEEIRDVLADYGSIDAVNEVLDTVVSSASTPENLEGWYFEVTLPSTATDAIKAYGQNYVILGPTDSTGYTGYISSALMKLNPTAYGKHNVPKGTYSVKELGKLDGSEYKMPIGWNAAVGVDDITLSGSQKDVTGYIHNQLRIPFVLKKSFEENNNQSTSNIYYLLTDNNTGKQYRLMSDKSGYAYIVKDGTKNTKNTAVYGSDKEKTYTKDGVHYNYIKRGTYTLIELGKLKEGATNYDDYENSYYMPEWWADVAPRTVEITPEKYAEGVAANSEIQAVYAEIINTSIIQITVHKDDGDTEGLDYLEGFQFGVYADEHCAGEPMEIITTAYCDECKKAVGHSEGRYAPGTYYLKEIKNDASKYYEVENDPVRIVLTPASNPTGVNQTVTIENFLYPAKVEVLKIDGDTETPLSGAIFKLYDSNKKLLETLPATNSSGKATTTNTYKPGNYYLQEYKMPEGYKADTTLKPITIDKVTSDGAVVTFERENTKKEAYVSVIKVDENNKSIYLSGAVFKMYSDSACTKEIDTLSETGTKGTYKTSKTHPFGTYYVKETVAPPGYQLNSTPVKVVIGKDVTDGATVKHTSPIGNTPKEAYVRIKKVDDKGNTVSGAIFGLYSDSTCTKALETNIKSASNGYAKSSNTYPPGTYYFKEIQSPAGHELDTSTYPITIPDTVEHNGVVTCTKTAVNPISPSKVGVYKTVASTGDKLKGVVYALYSDSSCSAASLVETLKPTDENGYAESENEYSVGTYYFKEVSCPYNCVLDPNAYPVTVSKSTTEKVFTIARTNKLKQVQLRINKLDAMTNKPLAGVSFRLYNEAGSIVETIKTDVNGWAYSENYYDTGTVFIVEEVSFPSGYSLMSCYDGEMVGDKRVSITLRADATSEYSEHSITIWNSPDGVFMPYKYDEQTGEPLPGAKLALYRPDFDQSILSVVYKKVSETITDDTGFGRFVLEDIDVDNFSSYKKAQWGVTSSNGASVTFSTGVSGTTDYDGDSRSIWIQNTSCVGNARGRLYYDVTGLEEGATYTLSAYVKTTSIKSNGYTSSNFGAVIAGTYFDSSGDSKGDQYSSYINTNTNGFVKVTRTFTIPEGQDITKLRINLAIRSATGIAYFDNIKLERELGMYEYSSNSFYIVETSAPDGYHMDNTSTVYTSDDAKNYIYTDYSIISTDINEWSKYVLGASSQVSGTISNQIEGISGVGKVVDVSATKLPSGMTLAARKSLNASSFTANNTYSISSYVQFYSGLGFDNSFGANIQVYLTYTDGTTETFTSKYLSDTTDYNGESDLTIRNNGYKRLAVDFTPSKNVSSAMLYLRLTGATGTVRFDDIRLWNTKETGFYGISIPNIPAYGDLTINKYSSETRSKLNGAEFELYDSDNSLVPLIRRDDGNYQYSGAGTEGLPIIVSGTQYVLGLPVGKYYLKETKAPSGYKLLSEPIEFEVSPNNCTDRGAFNYYSKYEVEYTLGNDVTVNIENRPNTESSITVTKIDSNTQKPLEGATFEMRKAPENLLDNTIDIPLFDGNEWQYTNNSTAQYSAANVIGEFHSMTVHAYASNAYATTYYELDYSSLKPGSKYILSAYVKLDDIVPYSSTASNYGFRMSADFYSNTTVTNRFRTSYYKYTADNSLYDGYERIELAFTCPDNSNITTVRIVFGMEYASGTMYFKDVNLTPNDYSYWKTAAWGGQDVTFTGNEVSGEGVDGGNAYALNVSQVTGSVRGRAYLDIPLDNLTVGDNYTFSAYVKTDNLVQSGNAPYGAGIAVTYAYTDGSYPNVYSDYIDYNTADVVTTNNGYTYLSVDFTLPDNLRYLRVNLQLKSATGTAYFDNMRLYANNKFNNFSDYSEYYWGGSSGTITYTTSVDTENYLFNGKSLKIDVTDCTLTKGGRAYYDVYGLTPGETYRFTAYVKTENIVGVSGQNNYGALINATYYNSAGTQTGNKSSPYLKTTNTDLSKNNGFVRLETDVTIPDDFSKLRLNLVLQSATGTVYFDEIKLEKTSDIITSFKTGSDGTASFKYVYDGPWELIEISAPKNYQLSNAVVSGEYSESFTVSQKNIVVPNDVSKGYVGIYKEDETNKAVGNAVYGLYSTNTTDDTGRLLNSNLVSTVKTDENGLGVFDTYYSDTKTIPTQLSNWTKKYWGANSVTYSGTSTDSSLTIKSTACTGNGYARYYYDIPVANLEVGSKYEYTAKVKTSDLVENGYSDSFGGVIFALLYDTSGSSTNYYSSVVKNNTDNEYTTLSVSFTVPNNLNYVRLCVGVRRATGTATFTDINLSKVNESGVPLFKTFYIQEITAPGGYQLNKEIYSTQADSVVDVKYTAVSDKTQRGYFILDKKTNTGRFMETEFELYTSDDVPVPLYEIGDNVNSYSNGDFELPLPLTELSYWDEVKNGTSSMYVSNSVSDNSMFVSIDPFYSDMSGGYRETIDASSFISGNTYTISGYINVSDYMPYASTANTGVYLLIENYIQESEKTISSYITIPITKITNGYVYISKDFVVDENADALRISILANSCSADAFLKDVKITGTDNYSDAETSNVIRTNRNSYETIVNLPIGDYYLIETKTEDGYAPYGDKIEFSIKPGQTNASSASNERIKVVNYRAITLDAGGEGQQLINYYGIIVLAVIMLLGSSYFIVSKKLKKQKVN